MPTDNPSAAVLDFMIRAYINYVGLMLFAGTHDQESESNLGGKLIYVGEIEESVRPLIAAANIAGAATLTASSEQPALRQAQRDGLIDFLVNSLDEALRILKNEIRKRQPVAVGICGPVQTIEAEMLERGVLPDLLPERDLSDRLKAFLSLGARQLPTPAISSGDPFHIWLVPDEYAQQPSAFEAILRECLRTDDHLNRRWLRLSSRYLGPHSRRLRSVACDPQAAAELESRFGPWELNTAEN